MDYIIVNGELYHHGVKGMRWGRRKAKEVSGGSSKKRSKKQRTPEQKAARRKNIAIATTAVAGTALAAYGAHKLSNVIKDRAFKKAMDRGSNAMESFIDNFNAKPYTVYERYKEDTSFAYEDYGRSAVKAIRNVISSNSVNNRVNWKGVSKYF